MVNERPLANPYSVGTWSEKNDEIVVEKAGVAAESVRKPSAEPRNTRHAASAAATADVSAIEDEQEDPPDPVELDRPVDPFELARRTVNRSQAAARDSGLYPRSFARAQREARDRSGSAPGYSGARPDPRDPQSLSAVMRKVMADLGWSGAVSSSRVMTEWDQIVGADIAAHCQPVSFTNGTLVLSATSSAWAAQLRMLSGQIVTRIDEHVGARVVADIKVTGPAAADRGWKKGPRTVHWRGPRDTYG